MSDLITQLNSALATPIAEKLPAADTAFQQDPEALLKTAVLLLEGLSHNVMSCDVWALSAIYARGRAREAELKPEEMHDSLIRLMEMINVNRKANPMASMF